MVELLDRPRGLNGKSETDSFELTPGVDATQEFIEIAHDFSNPLDIVREAISNGFDAGATNMEVIFNTKTESGEKALVITIKDNGKGMNREGLQSFFDLGNSLNRHSPEAIGEKGHGTKIYLNSKQICVESVFNGEKYKAIMDSPKIKLHRRELPIIEVLKESSEESNGTIITIVGYNNNRLGVFTHEKLKDYVKWFTKMGSIEREFNINNHKDFKLLLKGLDREEPEEIDFGHFFPKNSVSVDKLFEQYITLAPKHYCKKIIKSGNLENSPDIKYDAVFVLKG
jgi:hypothetical protein